MSTETHDLHNDGDTDATPDALTSDVVSTESVSTESVDAESAEAESVSTDSAGTGSVDGDPVDGEGGAAGTDGAQETASSVETAVTAEGGSTAKRLTRRESLEAEGDVAADFLEALLDIADMAGDIDVDIDGDRAAVSIVDSEDGRVPRRLVGPDGKVLEALQELTRLAVQTETGERSRLMLDVAGHRAARKAEVVAIAQGVIAEVRETGQQVEMDPMSAFERKIVHDEVLAAGLSSESDGVEPRRFVVVLPAS